METSSGILVIIAIIYAGIALTISKSSNFFFRVPNRAIDYLQWGYIFANVFATTTMPFSQELKVSYSLIEFSQNTNSWFCGLSEYTCQLQFGIAFAVCLFGVILIFRFITIPEKVREKGLTFHKVYRFFKGLIRWFYLPFAYLSAKMLINLNKPEVLPPIVFGGFCFLFPIIQLVLYKCFPED